jgi:hypothetical protein
VFQGQLVQIPDLDVGGDDAAPLSAGPEEPTAGPTQARRMERPTRDQKLNALAGSQVGTDYDALAAALAHLFGGGARCGMNVTPAKSFDLAMVLVRLPAPMQPSATIRS